MNSGIPTFDKDTFEQLASSVEDELSQAHLHAALNILSNMIGHVAFHSRESALSDQLQQTTEDYNRLLHYMAQGVEDPFREALQRRLIKKTFAILQDLRRSYDLQTQSNIYVATAREYWDKWERERFTPLLQRNFEGNFEAQDHLFNIIWTSPQLTPTEENELELLFLRTGLLVRCYIVSALTLANVHYFDAAKMRLLEKRAHEDNPLEKSRALLGIVLATHCHAKAFSIYSSLHLQLKELVRQSTSEIGMLQRFVCLYVESERMHEKMETEILPALIKVSQQRHKMGFDDMEINLNDEDQVPNISRKTKKKIAEGIMEMARLSQEGMDINLPAFSALKKFSFFNAVGHWLAPFTDARPEIPEIGHFKYMPFCDSDKYSVALLHSMMPAEQREGLNKMVKSHLEGMEPNEVKLQKEIQNVIQCLYRLFKRSPWVSTWPDIFSMDFLLINNGILGPILLADDGFLYETGLMLLRNNHFKEAEHHLNLYAEHRGTDFDLLMQMGVCAQEQGNYRKAATRFQQAHLLKPQMPNALYRLQYCHSKLGQYRAQLDALLELEHLLPEDSKITTEIGLCFIQLEKWDEAQNRFYKLEVQEKNLVPSMRAIAWCHLRMHQYAEAEKYYQRIIDLYPTNVTWEDRLNAGHVAWAMGDIRKALSRYIDYVHHYATKQPEETNLLRPFEEDQSLLMEMGFSKERIGLMHDMISQGIM